MIWTQADLDELKAAMRGGVLSVSYSGPPSRTVTYQSLDAMRKLAAQMADSIASQAGGTRSRLVSTRKGL